jgi:hypothetical protein
MHACLHTMRGQGVSGYYKGVTCTGAGCGGVGTAVYYGMHDTAAQGMLGRACVNGGCASSCGQVWRCMQQGAAVLRSLFLAAPAGPVAVTAAALNMLQHWLLLPPAISPACSLQHRSLRGLSVTAAAVVMSLIASHQCGSTTTTAAEARSSRHACCPFMLASLLVDGERTRWRQTRAGALQAGGYAAC